MKILLILLAQALWMPHTLTQNTCIEGNCQVDECGYSVCAAGKWHTVDTDYYECISDQVVPKTLSLATAIDTPTHIRSIVSLPSSTSTASPTLSSERPPPLNTARPSAPSSPGETGYSLCLGRTNAQRNTNVARASFLLGGKMASMYVADETSTFRCDDVIFPADKYYVAFWTQYDTSLQGKSQPAPINCGDRIEFTNPVNGRSASGVVIDRCASCVGVGRSPADPTMDLGLVNGATVDLSAELWQFLYEGEAGAVYDIEYRGPICPGWSREPERLTPNSVDQCGGSPGG